MSSRFMSINHFQYVPIVANREKKSSPYPDGDPDRQQNLTVCSLALATFPENFMQILFEVFFTKLLTDKQRRKHILLGWGNNLLLCNNFHFINCCRAITEFILFYVIWPVLILYPSKVADELSFSMLAIYNNEELIQDYTQSYAAVTTRTVVQFNLTLTRTNIFLCN